MNAKEALELAKKHEVKFVDLKFIDLPGTWQHTTIPAHRLERGALRGRHRLRRLVHPRLAAHQRVRHDHRRRTPRRRSIDPFTAHPTLSVICSVFHPESPSSPTRATRATSPSKAEAYLAPDRHRRHVVHGPRGRVLRLRRRTLRPVPAQRRLLLHRQHRGAVELGARGVPEPRLQGPPQGGLLPRPADRLARRSAPGDDAGPAGERHRGRGRTPRGRQRRPVRDRDEVRPAAAGGRPAPLVQVRRQEHRRASTARPRPSCRSRSSATTASGMHVHQSLWKDGKPLFGGRRVRRALHDRRSTTSAASSSTPSRSPRSPTRRPTRTAASSPASRPR